MIFIYRGADHAYGYPGNKRQSGDFASKLFLYPNLYAYLSARIFKTAGRDTGVRLEISIVNDNQSFVKRNRIGTE